MRMQIDTYLPVVRHWAQTKEIQSPAKGDHSYIGFPSIGDANGHEIVRLLQVEGINHVGFSMGEFVRLTPRS